MNTAMILLTLFVATEPNTGRYESSLYGAGTPAYADSARTQRQPAPPAPLNVNNRQGRAARAAYDNATPPTRVVPAQFETPGDWPQQPTDGLLGRSSASDADVPSVPMSGYTPPNYSREAARPGDLSAAPTETGDRERRSQSANMYGSADASSRYRTNDYSTADVTYGSQTRAQQTAAPIQVPTITPPAQTARTATTPSRERSGTYGDDYSTRTIRQPVAAPSPRNTYSDPSTNYASTSRPPEAVSIPVPQVADATSVGRDPVDDRAMDYDFGRANVAGDVSGTTTRGTNVTPTMPDIQVPAPQLRGNSYFLTLLALFGSIGLNMYLGWISWDTYNRYQDLVGDIRYTSPRRSTTVRETVTERVAEPVY